MNSVIPFDRSQPYLLPPNLKSWLPADDMAHFVVAAVERVPMNAFCVPVRMGGKAQCHPRLMLALLIFSYANGIFSSRRVERATYRDIGVRYDRIRALREQLALDIAKLMDQAEHADATDSDPQALPEE